MGPIEYQDLIQREFDRRKDRRPKYSLRAFARDLGVSASRLSEILNGGHNLSLATARLMADALNFPSELRDYFLSLVETKNKRSPKRRKEAKKRLKEIGETSKFRILEEQHFRAVADWYHFAILELTKLKSFKSDPKWISMVLGVSEAEAKDAIKRLLRLGLLEEMGTKIVLTNRSVSVSSAVPSTHIQSAHSQVLNLGIDALTEQHPDHRSYSANMISIDRRDVPKVKELIKDFRRSLCAYLDKSQNKESLYCLSIQFFELSKGLHK